MGGFEAGVELGTRAAEVFSIYSGYEDAVKLSAGY